MIRFDDDGGAAAQALCYQRRDVAEIHQRRHADARMCGRKAEVVRSIVRDCERMKINRPDLEIFARFYFFGAVAQSVGAFPRLIRRTMAVLADVGFQCFAGDKDGAVQVFEQHAQATGMIAMLVRDDDAVELAGVATRERQASHNLFGAQTRINKHARLIRRNQDGVARRAASENSESHKTSDR